jgi:hypothetical protein
MGQKKKYPDELIVDALEKCAGIVSHAADMIGARPDVLHARIKRSEYLKKVTKDCREVNLDLAESKLMELIKKGQPSAIIFFLKCLGKERGYVERIEQTGKDGKELQLPISAPPRATSMEEWIEQNRQEATAA